MAGTSEITNPLHLPAPAPSVADPVEILYQLTGAVSQATTFEAIYDAALESLAQGLGTDRAAVLLFDPDGVRHRVPIQEGRAVFFGTRAGFYRLMKTTPQVASATLPPPMTAGDVMFAANLADPSESRIEPRPELLVDGKKGGAVEGFKVGVRRELWIYLLIAAAVITTLEWLTYHRRMTV